MSEPCFLVDRSLGRLARWLRVLGYDTVWDKTPKAEELLARAADEGRVLLTRDTLLMRRRAVTRGQVHPILIRHNELDDQLRQVRDEVGVRRLPVGRCLACNAVVESCPVEQVRDVVPPYVAATQTEFKRCPRCGRITWPATHWEHMRSRLEGLGL